MRAALLATLVITISAFGVSPKGVDLASLNGWDIVIAEDAIPSEIYAAKEFQNHFELASGIKLPIVKAIDRPDLHVFIGPGKLMRCNALGFDVDEFGDEDLRIVVRDNNIVIAGGQPRGTLYGVYTFLEDYLGVRFLTAEHTYVPAVGKWRLIGPIDRFYHPPLNYRYSYYGEVHNNHAFAARLRVNTVTHDPNLGCKTKLRNINHSFLEQVPVEKYGKEHPEYYSLVDGERQVQFEKNGYYNQLCLTNPDVLRIVTDSVLAELKANPDLPNISVSMNDGSNYCRCPNCAAIDEREGSQMGSLLTFVNAVADEVAKEYPNVMVGTLAYSYVRKPPKNIKPRPNIQIQLCYRSCMVHPIEDPNCPLNAEFCKEFSDWGKICKNIYVWSYNANTFDYLSPWPNLRGIGPDIRYYVANNVKGMFAFTAGSVGSNFSELRNYMIAGMLWDPSRDGQQLMDEFLELHYGKAAGPIRRFINLIHDHTEASGQHYNSPFKQCVQFGIDESIAKAGLDAFAEAIELADNEAIKMRVEKASICAYRAAVDPIWRVKSKEELDKLNPALVVRMRPLLKRLFELCEKHGVDRSDMLTKVGFYRDRLKQMVGY